MGIEVKETLNLFKGGVWHENKISKTFRFVSFISVSLLLIAGTTLNIKTTKANDNIFVEPAVSSNFSREENKVIFQEIAEVSTSWEKVDPNVIPYGSKNRIDIFFTSHDSALSYGVQTCEVWIERRWGYDRNLSKYSFFVKEERIFLWNEQLQKRLLRNRSQHNCSTK